MRIPTTLPALINPELIQEPKKVSPTQVIIPTEVRENAPRLRRYRRGPPSPMRLIDRRKRERRNGQQSTTLDTRIGKDRRNPDDIPTNIRIKA